MNRVSIVTWYVLILLIGFLVPTEARQRGNDSPRFELLLDSVKSLLDERKTEEARTIGLQLLSEVMEAGDRHYLIQTHIAMFRAYNRLDDIDEAERTTLECITLSKELEDYKSQIICASNRALLFFNEGKYDSSRVYYQLSMEVARDHLPERYPISLANMAFIHGVMDQRDQELKYFIKALEVVDEHPEYKGAVSVSAMAFSGLGDYYLSIDEFDKAVAYYERKLKLATENDLIRSAYEARIGLGSAYAKDEFYDFEKSRSYYEAITSDTTEDLSPYRHRGMLGLARLYLKEGEYDQSLMLFQQVLDYYRAVDSPDYMSRVQTGMADIYFRRGQWDLSRKVIEEGLSNARKYGVIARERDALKVLYRLDSAEGRYRAAFDHFYRYRQIIDSLYNIRTKDKINALQIEFETEQTAKQNTILQADLEVESLRSQRQVGVSIFIGILALLLVILSFIFYRSYLRKKKDHDTIATQADELRLLSDFKDGLTSMVVHDMKNPINSIIGFSRGTPDEKKMKKINQSGYSVLNLVTNMLDIQRFEDTKVEVVPARVNARQMLVNAMAEVHLLLQAKSLRVDNQLPKGLMVDVERQLIDRVLINLLTNAIKYSGLGTVITVAAGKRADGLQEIILRDEGEGIAADKLPYIFNKFWHKDARKAGLAPSTGLGLSFCKLAVEAHGGSIHAESEPMQGTSIIFSVPVSTEVIPETAVAENPDELIPDGVLTSDELALLEEFILQLSTLEVHEVSAINKLIKLLESKGLNRVWLNLLQGCVYQGDQEKYDELLRQVLDKEAAEPQVAVS
jgi:signal transduction histidine kinase